MSHLTCWLSFGQVGLAQLVRTHWVTTTNFMGFHPIPRSRAYLGASMPWFGVELVRKPGFPVTPRGSHA
jgi:hypothetical protein